MVALGDVLGAARILVVDDEPANVRLLDRLLTNAGCQHVTAITDPRETIGDVRARAARPASSSTCTCPTSTASR